MEKLEIYKFQAKDVADTLNAVANLLKSRSRTTCLDREIMVSIQMMYNVLKGTIDVHTERD